MAWRGRPSREIAVGTIAPTIGGQFHSKLQSIGRQRALRAPGDRLPSADGHPAIGEWNGMDLVVRDQHALRHEGNAMIRCREGDESLRSGPLKSVPLLATGCRLCTVPACKEWGLYTFPSLDRIPTFRTHRRQAHNTCNDIPVAAWVLASAWA